MSRAVRGAVRMLPDFRNLGVLLRSIVLAEAAKSVFMLAGVADWPGFVEGQIAVAGLFEPVLIMVLLVLMAASAHIARWPYEAGRAAVLLLVMGGAAAWSRLAVMGGMPPFGIFKAMLLSLALSWGILEYFAWRQQSLSQALPEARLMALQARIRPHFLFNSLNTVLGLIRTEPRLAESVLENLADLFRATMSENNILVRLDQEMALANAYLNVEKIRLGDRLVIDWQCQNAPADALVPPLMLQPLLENAVYHGVEAADQGGRVNVSIFVKDAQLNMVVRNSFSGEAGHGAGNRMALNNIRERLDLHFDAEATLRAYQAGDEFVVQIRMPFKHG